MKSDEGNGPTDNLPSPGHTEGEADSEIRRIDPAMPYVCLGANPAEGIEHVDLMVLGAFGVGDNPFERLLANSSDQDSGTSRG